MAKKRQKSNKRKVDRQTIKRTRMIWIMGILLVPVVVGIIYSTMPKHTARPSGPRFEKEGELQFIKGDTGDTITSIDLEIAQTKEDRNRGLMWRKSMEEDQGMLFIMDKLEPQSFWMLNTYLSLDIIFLDDNLRIVTIRKNTKPQSLDPVLSNKPAKYVVEVLAGFSDRYELKEGDLIAFQKEEQVSDPTD